MEPQPREKRKQQITRQYDISAGELKKRKKAQRVFKIIAKPAVLKTLKGMIGAMDLLKAPFKKGKSPDNEMAKYIYFKFARWFYYYAQKPQRDDLVVPPAPGIDKETRQMIDAMLQELGLTLFGHDEHFYHAKVVTNRDIKKVINIDEDINITPSDTTMPYKTARQLILESQEEFAAAPCICRNACEDSCVPKDRLYCIYVGKENVDFVAEHSSWAKRINRQEALDIIDQAREDGLVHTVFWNRWVSEGPFCLCNCCSCHCGGLSTINLSANMIPMFSETGEVANVDEAACIACSSCVKACHFEAITLDEVKNAAVVDETKCFGCEVCLGICQDNAIAMRKGPSGATPLFADIEA